MNILGKIKRRCKQKRTRGNCQGDGKRYRSLGCYPCTKPIQSDSTSVKMIIEELKSGKLANIAERSGREQDKEDGGSLETLRRDGYM